MEEPRWKKSSTDNELPRRTLLKSDIDAPIWQKDFIERVLPHSSMSRIDKHDASRAMPNRENVDPNLPKLPNDKELPMYVFSKTDSVPPSLVRL
jgi:hypothetical protein